MYRGPAWRTRAAAQLRARRALHARQEGEAEQDSAPSPPAADQQGRAASLDLEGGVAKMPAVLPAWCLLPLPRKAYCAQRCHRRNSESAGSTGKPPAMERGSNTGRLRDSEHLWGQRRGVCTDRSVSDTALLNGYKPAERQTQTDRHLPRC